uniref:Leucine-rich repeat-containing N-terminal plant-type domain-containing protein n=1 Tax=Ditylum brightwellii TaxID=49249 RepID=A0A7S4W1R4_9STRA
MKMVSFSCPQDDETAQRYVVNLLFFSLHGPWSTLSASWLNEFHECDWYGLNCTDGWITTINIGVSHLEGSIPKEIAMLTYLRSLRINSNHITGSIPKHITKIRPGLSSTVVAFSINIAAHVLVKKILRLK